MMHRLVFGSAMAVVLGLQCPPSTDRVAISAQGIHVAGAKLPQGHHHLVMRIADSQGKIGSREAVFDIR
jgi:hypothetical protein